MNSPAVPPPSRPSLFSPEALVGIGMTLFSLGILFLLLGWAQVMRQVKDAALILGAIGAVLFVVGVIAALAGRVFKRR